MNNDNFHQSHTGLLLPDSARPVGVRCGYCPEIIFKQNEARGRLFMLDDRPACARCRILKRSRFANQIRRDAPLRDRDLAKKKKIAEDAEVLRVAKIAHESQKRANTSSEKKLSTEHQLGQQ